MSSISIKGARLVEMWKLLKQRKSYTAIKHGIVKYHAQGYEIEKRMNAKLP
jgi:hypothetical protein